MLLRLLLRNLLVGLRRTEQALVVCVGENEVDKGGRRHGGIALFIGAVLVYGQDAYRVVHAHAFGLFKRFHFCNQVAHGAVVVNLRAADAGGGESHDVLAHATGGHEVILVEVSQDGGGVDGCTLAEGVQCDSRVERVVVDSVIFAVDREAGRKVCDEGLSLCSIILVGVGRRGLALISGTRLTRLGGSDAFSLALQDSPLVGKGPRLTTRSVNANWKASPAASLSPAWQAAPDA